MGEKATVLGKGVTMPQIRRMREATCMRVVKRGARTMPKEGGVLATWFLVCCLVRTVIVISVS